MIAIARDRPIARAFIKRNCLRLAAAGLQANDLVAAPSSDVLECSQHGATETLAPVGIADIHPLYFDGAKLHRPKCAASHGDTVHTPDKEHTTGLAEINGIDSMDRQAWVARGKVAIKGRDQAHCF